ncbi:MAG TPA: serine/threonine-protein kinase, partial [Gemmatimonadales bacterium]|nr:serine/threonine-protein kinase [Gemmatimonadales bacterium]
MPDLRTQLQAALTGSYTLQRELGRGGMATVFLAHDLKHDRPVALKVLHPELAASLGPERFQREIRFAARLQHPHILTVLDSGRVEAGADAPEQLWFTMPYVEGESLRDRLRRERQLPVEDAVQIAREAARALDYAHQHGVVHRDIKPENILLTRDGSTLVADFGIARAIGADERLTQTGMAVGTPAYMSPEQAAGDRGLDPRTDMYSLGAVLYEMLAGEPPFTGPTAQVILMRRLTESPRPLRELRETVPAHLEQAVQKALARAPADRFASAGQFAQALQASVTAPTPAPTLVTHTPRVVPEPGGGAGDVGVSGPTTPPAIPPSVKVAPPAAAPALHHKRRIPTAAITLALGFAIGLGLLFAWRRTHGGSEGEASGAKRIAVLPFENLGDSADAYFADGVTDAVRGKLMVMPGLEVIASNSSNEYRHTPKSPQQIARELGVDYLLVGKVRFAKGKHGATRVQGSP